MGVIIAFLLKSVILSGLLTSYYWFVLRNKKIHSFNRFYLLFALIISLIVPLFQINWWNLSQDTFLMDDRILSGIDSTRIAQSVPRADWTWLLVIVAAVFTTVLLAIFISKLIWIYKIKRKHVNVRMDGFILIETQLKEAPFCFLNNLFWKTSISWEGDGKRIFQHELTHIKQKHSYDKLLSQTLVCFFWMNPFFWIMQKELNMIHEFSADANATDEKNADSFARMLLVSHNESRYIEPYNSFFQSSVKRRLLMITSPEPKFVSLRMLAALLVITMGAITFSFKIPQSRNDQILKDKLDKFRLIKIIKNPDSKTIEFIIEGSKTGQSFPMTIDKQKNPV